MESITTKGEQVIEWQTFSTFSLALYYASILTNDKLKEMFPNLHALANVCMTMTASMERILSQMKMIKLT